MKIEKKKMKIELNKMLYGRKYFFMIDRTKKKNNQFCKRD